MFDFELSDEWSPAAPTTREEHEDIDELALDWDLVAHVGSAHDGHEWLVFVDTAACYGVPGQDDVVAVHLVRDRTTRTYTVERATFADIAQAEGWLRTRGAGDLTRVKDMAGPDDDATREIEDRVREGFAHHHRVYSFVDHAAMTSRAVYRDSAATDPAQAFLAQVSYMAGPDTYAIREESFATAGEAVNWADTYHSPQPRTEAFPSHTSARAQTTVLPAVHAADSPTRVVEIVPSHRPARNL